MLFKMRIEICGAHFKVNADESSMDLGVQGFGQHKSAPSKAVGHAACERGWKLDIQEQMREEDDGFSQHDQHMHVLACMVV